jgi:hypothetical protein
LFASGHAALEEQLTLNQRVQGSSPCAPTNYFKGLVDFTAVATQK